MMDKTRGAIFAAALLSATLLAPASWAADAAAGKATFGTKCKTCHGAEGQGNPGMAKILKIEFKDLGGAEVQKMSDDDIKKVIMEGTGKMKPVSGLAAKDVDNVVAFIRTLKK